MVLFLVHSNTMFYTPAGFILRSSSAHVDLVKAFGHAIPLTCNASTNQVKDVSNEVFAACKGETLNGWLIAMSLFLH